MSSLFSTNVDIARSADGFVRKIPIRGRNTRTKLSALRSLIKWGKSKTQPIAAKRSGRTYFKFASAALTDSKFVMSFGVQVTDLNSDDPWKAGCWEIL